MTLVAQLNISGAYLGKYEKASVRTQENVRLYRAHNNLVLYGIRFMLLIAVKVLVSFCGTL
jgi:hypothetical protein